MNKSWTLTTAVYIITVVMIVQEAFTGLHVSDTQIQSLVLLTGSTTAGGVANSVLSKRGSIKSSIEELKSLAELFETQKPKTEESK